jgi:C_GCAxxG_C_C family probable redox protein
MKPNRIEDAVARFSSGNNCAQSVFAAYADLLGISDADARRIAWGFGGGMGRLQLTCGAVTGAIMLIGAARGMGGAFDEPPREKIYALVKQLCAEFAETAGSLCCADLLGLDLNTPEGNKRFAEEKMHELKCAGYVREGARLVEELLF